MTIRQQVVIHSPVGSAYLPGKWNITEMNLPPTGLIIAGVWADGQISVTAYDGNGKWRGAYNAPKWWYLEETELELQTLMN